MRPDVEVLRKADRWKGSEEENRWRERKSSQTETWDGKSWTLVAYVITTSIANLQFWEGHTGTFASSEAGKERARKRLWLGEGSDEHSVPAMGHASGESAARVEAKKGTST